MNAIQRAVAFLHRTFTGQYECTSCGWVGSVDGQPPEELVDGDGRYSCPWCRHFPLEQVK